MSRRGQAKPRPQAAPRRAEGILWKTRLTLLGISAVVVAAGVVGVLSAAGRSSSGRPAPLIIASASQADREVSALLDGIPQSGNTLGQATAPVTLQVFLDLQCLTSKLFVISFLPSIIHDWVRTNELKIEFHSRETDTHNPRVFVNQQMAALIAGEQNKLWNFVDTFYHEQGQEYTGYVTESYLRNIASQVPGLNLERWSNERQNETLFRQIVADRQTAIVRRLRSTPALLLGRTGGKMTRLQGYEEPELPGSLVDAMSLKEAIEKLP